MERREFWKFLKDKQVGLFQGQPEAEMSPQPCRNTVSLGGTRMNREVLRGRVSSEEERVPLKRFPLTFYTFTMPVTAAVGLLPGAPASVCGCLCHGLAERPRFLADLIPGQCQKNPRELSGHWLRCHQHVPGSWKLRWFP